MSSRFLTLAQMFALGLLLLAPGIAHSQPVHGIPHIREFLKTCPDRDPLIVEIRSRFEIRVEGGPAAVVCTEPYNEMRSVDISMQLAYLQAMRVMYYMDLGRSNYLPWTNLRLFDWVTNKVAGINFSTSNTVFSCCRTIDGKVFINGPIFTGDKSLYLDFRGMAGAIAVLAHEARHRDGFGHVGCCAVGGGGCDQEYNESNLSPYGIQSWLFRNWLNGNVNVGLYCSYANQVYAASFSLSGEAIGYQSRFCGAGPPVLPRVVGILETPGGSCELRTLTLPPGSLANAAAYANNVLVPGQISTVFAPGLGPENPVLAPRVTPQGSVDTELGGTRVLFMGHPGPMIYATRDQLSAVAPWTINGVPTETGFHTFVEVERNGQLSNIVLYPYAERALQLFTVNQTGRGQAAAVNEDGTINSPEDPAARGSIVSVYGTGGGRTTPEQTTGEVVPPVEPLPHLPRVRVTVGYIDAEVLYAGAAPGAVAGLVQVNFRVPGGAGPGAVIPMAVFLGGNTNEVFLAVK